MSSNTVWLSADEAAKHIKRLHDRAAGGDLPLEAAHAEVERLITAGLRSKKQGQCVTYSEESLELAYIRSPASLIRASAEAK